MAQALPFFGGQCADLFTLDNSAQMRAKQNYVSEAFREINLAKPDDKNIEPILADWNLANTTPWGLEQIAQALVIENTDLEKNFFRSLQGFFLGTSTKEFFQVRIQTLSLRDALANLLIKDGRLKKNTWLQNVRKFMSENQNKYKLGKFIVINGGVYLALSHLGLPTLHPLFGLPIVYVPALNFVANIHFSREDLKKSYQELRWKYKIPYAYHKIFIKLPRLLFASVALSVAYNYVPYVAQEMTVEAQEVATQTVFSIPQTNPLYIAWEHKYENTYGHAPNLSIIGGSNLDKASWEKQETVVRDLFRKEFVQAHGREPELYNPKDISEWGVFLAQFRSAAQAGASASRPESGPVQ